MQASNFFIIPKPPLLIDFANIFFSFIFLSQNLLKMIKFDQMQSLKHNIFYNYKCIAMNCDGYIESDDEMKKIRQRKMKNKEGEMSRKRN